MKFKINASYQIEECDSYALLSVDIEGYGNNGRLAPGNIYRADERQMLIDRLDALADDCPKALRDSVRQEVERVKATLEPNRIEMFELAIHMRPTHEECKAAYLRRRIADYVDDATMNLLVNPTSSESKQVNRFMSETIFARISNTKGRWSDEYISHHRFKEAAQNALLELITEHNAKTILITDKNVDGCGDDVEVSVRVNKAPTEDDYAKLRAALAEQKSRCAEECLDTDAMIESACDAVFGKGNWQPVRYESFIEF